MTKETERRAIASEVRASGRKLVGYAAVFNTPTTIADFSETIAPGAFSATLADNHDILGLVDHDSGRLLGRTRSRTLRLSEDGKGLAFEIEIPDTTLGRDVLALAERGDLGGASFAFSMKREAWEGNRRTLQDLVLHEISVVHAWPAYPTTSVSARRRNAAPALTALERRRRILARLERGQ